MVQNRYQEVLDTLERRGVIKNEMVPVAELARALVSEGLFPTSKSAANAIDRNPFISVDYDASGKRCGSRKRKIGADTEVTGFVDSQGYYRFTPVTLSDERLAKALAATNLPPDLHTHAFTLKSLGQALINAGLMSEKKSGF